jgi:hypothetical protein
MPGEFISVDITNPDALVRAAEDVARTQQPQIITRGAEAVAMLSPIKPRRTKQLGRPLTKRDSLFQVIGRAHVANADDVVDNHDQYLAHIYHADLNQSIQE